MLDLCPQPGHRKSTLIVTSTPAAKPAVLTPKTGMIPRHVLCYNACVVKKLRQLYVGFERVFMRLCGRLVEPGRTAGRKAHNARTRGGRKPLAGPRLRESIPFFFRTDYCKRFAVANLRVMLVEWSIAFLDFG